MSQTPDGQLGTFGGRQVHWSARAGRGTPVLLLGGCGVGPWVWPELVDQLGDRSVLVLDRPGMAGTPWPGRLPTLAEEVATLAGFVAAEGGGPVVVAGHSMAGPHAEALARVHPELVAGLVLVDASVESPTPEPDPATEARWLKAAEVARKAMRLRPLQPLGPLAERIMSSFQSRKLRLFDDVSPAARTAYRDPETVAAVVAEQAAYDRQLSYLDALRSEHPWPSIPVRVLTAAGDGGQDWVQVQRGLAERLGGEQIVLDDSRHLVMLDRPDALAAAIDAVAPLTPTL